MANGRSAGEVLIVWMWALDRITREGAATMLRIIRQFKRLGVIIVSVKVPWLDGAAEVQDVPGRVR